MADAIDMAQAADRERDIQDSLNQLDTGDATQIRRDIDAQQNAEDIKTLMSQLADDEDEDEFDEFEEQEAPEEEVSVKETPKGKRPGIDVALKEIENKLGPEYAEVVRGLQSVGTKRAQETAELQAELRGVLLDVQRMQTEQMRNSGNAKPEAEPVVRVSDQLKPEQRALLDGYLAENGYIRKADIDHEQAIEASNNNLKQSIQRGIETYGERFGTFKGDGTFQYSDEVKDHVQDIWNRVGYADDGTPLGDGFTADDLYKIADYDRLLQEMSATNEQEEVVEAPESRSTTQAERKRMAQKASRSVVRSNGSSRNGTPNIYKKGEDTFEAVIQKAAAMAHRDIYAR